MSRIRLPLGVWISRDFKRGLSFLGLARKYGRTVAQVEALVRRRSGRRTR